MTQSVKSDRLTAHNRGVLAFLRGARTQPPPRGSTGSLLASVRAGWFSARKALTESISDDRE